MYADTLNTQFLLPWKSCNYRLFLLLDNSFSELELKNDWRYLFSQGTDKNLNVLGKFIEYL